MNRLLQESLKKDNYLGALKIFEKLDFETLPDDHPAKITLYLDTPLTPDLIRTRAKIMLDTQAMAKKWE